MRRPQVDTSRAKCDECGGPWVEGEAVYSVASHFSELEGEDHILLSFRHWKCHTPVDVAIKNLRGVISEAESALEKLRGR